MRGFHDRVDRLVGTAALDAAYNCTLHVRNSFQSLRRWKWCEQYGNWMLNSDASCASVDSRERRGCVWRASDGPRKVQMGPADWSTLIVIQTAIRRPASVFRDDMLNGWDWGNDLSIVSHLPLSFNVFWIRVRADLHATGVHLNLFLIAED